MHHFRFSNIFSSSLSLQSNFPRPKKNLFSINEISIYSYPITSGTTFYCFGWKKVDTHLNYIESGNGDLYNKYKWRSFVFMYFLYPKSINFSSFISNPTSSYVSRITVFLGSSLISSNSPLGICIFLFYTII